MTSGVVLWNVLSGPARVLASRIASSEVCSSSSLVIAGVALTRHTLTRVTAIHPRPTHPLATSHHVLLLLLLLLLLPLGLGHVARIASLLLTRVASSCAHHAGVTRLLSSSTWGIARGAARRTIARGILAWLWLSVVSGVVLLARKLMMLGMVVGTRGLLLLLLMLLLLLLLLVFTTAPKQLQILASGGLAAVVCHLI